jgi:hypothetical protein
VGGGRRQHGAKQAEREEEKNATALERARQAVAAPTCSAAPRRWNLPHTIKITPIRAADGGLQLPVRDEIAGYTP